VIGDPVRDVIGSGAVLDVQIAASRSHARYLSLARFYGAVLRDLRRSTARRGRKR
jgi:hypothetical protein